MIDPTIVQRVREQVLLLDLVREHGVQLRRKGSDWWGCCPFHSEQSGSFKVSERRNAYKCFGCGAGGDVISFYILTHGLDAKLGFPTALTELGRRVGISVDDGRAGTPVRKHRPKESREEVQAKVAHKRSLALAKRAQQSRREIIARYPWTYAEIQEESPIQIDDAEDQARCLLSLFAPKEIVWAGDVMHSISKDDVQDSKPEWRQVVSRHFRTAGDWLSAITTGELPGPRICACAFKPGTRYTRSLENVSLQRFLVVEHDKLSLDEQAAILRWLRDGARLHLRAIVYTGGKSLHGWFDYPVPPREASRLKVMLCGVQEEEEIDGRVKRVWRGGLGVDVAGWNAVQPWKVPGWPHPKTNSMAELIWFGGAA